ncbi:MAG: hypothetical protein GY931_04410 [Maribacter sp.]|nr:hypothetical protein [Maribacter sp.]
MVKHNIINIILGVISVVFAMGIGEFLYRIYLTTTLQTSIEEEIPKHILNFTVHDQVYTKFDQEYGYTFLPNNTIAN